MDDQTNSGGFERQMFKGDWNCGKCNAEIKELPFDPDPARLNQLTCRDCYKKQQAEKFGR